MRGEDHTPLAVRDILLQKFQNFHPHYRVKSVGRLIQHKQLRISGKHGGKHQFHLHPPGKILHRHLPIQLPPLRQLVKLLCPKRLIKVPQHAPDISDPEVIREIKLIPDIPDTLLVSALILLTGYAVHIDLPAAALADIRDQIQRRTLPGTVLPYIPHDISPGQRKTDIIQQKCFIFFRKIAYFQ